MRRYLRIYRTFIRSSLSRELEFRANFLAKIAQNVMWIAFFVLVLLVVYGNTKTVAGWDRSAAFILGGTVEFVRSLSQAFFFSLTEIPEQVRRGTLDYVVTRPVDSQFWVSTRRFNFDQIGSLIAAAVLVSIGIAGAHVAISATAWISYLFLVLSATALLYSLNLALMTTGIWLVRVDNLWVLSDSIVQVAHYPVDIYSPIIRRVLTFFLPLAFMSTVPARELLQGFSPGFVALGIVWAIVGLFLSRAFWHFAMRHYGSASS